MFCYTLHIFFELVGKEGKIKKKGKWDEVNAEFETSCVM
jgi:hypothetical protein